MTAITATDVEQALIEAGLRWTCDAIDDEAGAVVLWHGDGHPVDTIDEAIELARDWAAEHDA